MLVLQEERQRKDYILINIIKDKITKPPDDGGFVI